jgi:hypothetical protein
MYSGRGDEVDTGLEQNNGGVVHVEVVQSATIILAAEI